MQRGLSARCLKVGEEVKRALSQIFQELGLLDPALEGLILSVTEVQMSPDIKTAKVFLYPLGGLGEKDVLKSLNQTKPMIRRLLGQKVYLKYVPELIFALDDSFNEATHINRLLKKDRVRRDLEGPEE